MITEQEKQEIIEAAVEKALLLLPDVIGNLIMTHVSQLRLNRDFYLKYPEFRNSKDIVASVLEVVEGKNPNKDYEKLLEEAVPLIKERIKEAGKLDVKSVPRPNRTYHGEL